MEIKTFGNIDVNDQFFDSLKEDYNEFSQWFLRKSKSSATAFVQYDDSGCVQAFLYLKIEDGELSDVDPIRSSAKRLKVGTFKIDAHNTKLGESFIKKIVTSAILDNVVEVYVTIFEKHASLIALLSCYGFVVVGVKGGGDSPELVLVKDMQQSTGNVLLDYPLLSTSKSRKFVLSIMPKFHTRMFPDSILNNEKPSVESLVQDVSYTNSIHKIYICQMQGVEELSEGDILLIYRTSDHKGPARFRSVVTSVCVVQEVKKPMDFSDVNEFINYTNSYSVFDDVNLKSWFANKSSIVVKMTYNSVLSKRITNGEMLDELDINPSYWGFFELSNDQFNKIISRGRVDENFIVD